MPTSPVPDWVLTRRRMIGEHIRTARLYANLTQEEVAERADVGKHTISHIEAGHTAARLDTLIRLADAIGVPLAYLVRE